MQEELNALKRNKTYKIVPVPKNKKPYGSIKWYKARLVAKDFTQIYGIDYQKYLHP
jgi:predicted amidophosphoribosyltransferase